MPVSSPRMTQLSLFSSSQAPEEVSESQGISTEKEVSYDRGNPPADGTRKKSSPRKNNGKTTAKNQSYQLSLLKFLDNANLGSVGDQQPGTAERVGKRPGTPVPAPVDSNDARKSGTVESPERSTPVERYESDGDTSERLDRNESGVILPDSIENDSLSEDESENEFSIELSPQKKDLFIRNYRITELDTLGKGGPAQKIQDNFRAIQLLKNPETISPEEMQRALVKYVGWGGLPQIFDPDNKEFEQSRFKLTSLLDEKEFIAARRSTQDAHFTSETIVRAMWKAVQNMGIKGTIRALEPAMGTGNFLGLAPQELDLSWHGIELDPVTAQIARSLYPEETILNMSFTAFPSNASMFNLTIGNPPFGQQNLFDADFSGPKNLSIHNYFLAKSISLLEPGGLAAFVVSRFFLDAKDSTTREFIAEQADFLGAIRLPNTAFQENALTKVTTDLVFFQKNTGEKLYSTDWINTTESSVYKTNQNYMREEIKYTLNNWFHKNPRTMLGQMEFNHGMFQNSIDCTPYKYGDDFNSETRFKQQLNETIENLFPEKAIYKTFSYKSNEEHVEQNISFVKTEYFENLKTGAFAIEPVSGAIISKCPVDSDLAKAFFEVNGKNNFRLNWYTEIPCKPAQRKKIQMYIELRDTLKTLFKFEKTNNTKEIELYRQKLNQEYDLFVKESGFLNSSTNHNLFKLDPESALVEALEKNYSKGLSIEAAKKKGVHPYPASAEKADVFTRQVLFPPLIPAENMSTMDALLYCLHQHGRIFPSVIAEIKGASEETITEELLQSERVFKNPVTEIFETREKYLSGNVKKKLQQAITISDTEKNYEKNIKALEEIIPADISPVDIGVHFGVSWIPVNIVSDFIYEVIYEDTEKEKLIELSYSPLLVQSAWTFKNYSYNSVADTVIWGIPEFPAYNLISAILNNRPIKVETENDSGEKVLDYDNTMLANQKAEKIKQAFADWIWKDDERRELLTRIYNDTFNCHVPPQYDGSHFTLVNATENVTLRPHQKTAIWRAIQEGGGLFDHVVGAGKTMVAIATIMESKRMGLCSKPMIVVPNSLLYQWRNEFLRLYPNANILVAEKTDFTKDNRERLFSRIATGVWDAIVIGHSSFGRIEMPFNEQKIIFEEEIQAFAEAIVEQGKQQGKSREIKKLEKKKESLENNLKELLNKMNRTDRAMNFSDMGIDRLFIDESQEFKNLFFNTNQQVLGLGSPAGSAKAFDLFIKARYIQRMNGNNSGVYFMTGTPISNTIAEMYTLQRYLQYETLQEKNIRVFDEWAKVFGKVVTAWELDASGVGYKLASRFSQFQNVPELLGMYRTVADVVTKKDIDQQQKEQNLPSLTPPVKGGKPEGVIAERSISQEIFMDEIIHRFANMPSDPRDDNPLKATNDARKAGLDYRLIDPLSEDSAESKINLAVQNIFSIWEETKEQKGTQLVFCDLSTPKNASDFISQKKDEPEKELTLDENTIFIEALETLEKENENNEDKTEGEIIFSEGEEEENIPPLDSTVPFFSIYEDVRNKLVAKGIPLTDIAFVHDAETDVQKARLFAAMQTGSIRVLLGSTKKMGAGVNVQRRLVAAHHLDMPWRPSDLEQRNGRIIRQGNLFFENDTENFQVQIYYYLTKQMYDARMCQTLETKAYAIEQFRAGDMSQREIRDIRAEAATLAEMKAAASGNPLIFLEVELNTELQRLESLSKQYHRNLYSLRTKISQIEKNPETIQKLESKKEKHLAFLEKNTKRITDKNGVSRIEHVLSFDGKTYGEEKTNTICNRLNAVIGTQAAAKGCYFATYRGLDIHVINQIYGKDNWYQFSLIFDDGESYRPNNLNYLFSEKFSLSGFFTRIDNWLEKDCFSAIDYQIAAYNREYKSLDKLLIEINEPFKEEEQLKLTRFNHESLLFELKTMQDSKNGINENSTWTPARSIEEMEGKTIEIEQKKTKIDTNEDKQKIENKKLKDKTFGKDRDICLITDNLCLPEQDMTKGEYFYCRRNTSGKEPGIVYKNHSSGTEYRFVYLEYEHFDKLSWTEKIDVSDVCVIPHEKSGRIKFLLSNEYERGTINKGIESYGIKEYEKKSAENFPRTYDNEMVKAVLDTIQNGEKTAYDILCEKETKKEKLQIKKGLSS